MAKSPATFKNDKAWAVVHCKWLISTGRTRSEAIDNFMNGGTRDEWARLTEYQCIKVNVAKP